MKNTKTFEHDGVRYELTYDGEVSGIAQAESLEGTLRCVHMDHVVWSERITLLENWSSYMLRMCAFKVRGGAVTLTTSSEHWRGASFGEARRHTMSRRGGVSVETLTFDEMWK